MGRPITIIISLIPAILIHTSKSACPRTSSKILDDILSPANAERALQILRLAAVGARVSPSNPGYNLLEELVPRYVPSVVQGKPIVPEVRRIRQPLTQVVKEACPQIVSPVVQEKVYTGVPIPQPYAVSPIVPEVYPSAPVPLVNPFLPAASPVSAIAPPTSSLLPPVDPTQVRSHFLRKIPIPPPSL